jgi:amino acid permease
MRAGGLISSTISIVAATVGSGNISLAYAFMKNGYILGMITILIGALLSYYSGMLIVKCAHKTGKLRYEDIASEIYG